MQQFTLAEGDTTGHVFAPLYPVPGDHLLIVERELLYKGKKVGTISAVLMEVFPLMMPSSWVSLNIT